jgi:hypothetical protein
MIKETFLTKHVVVFKGAVPEKVCDIMIWDVSFGPN